MIWLIIGTRPNIIKALPVYNALTGNVKLIHTGQHYDYQMNQVFFDDLGLKDPDVNLGATTMSEIMAKLNSLEKPDLVIVFGDVMSTLAGALYANENKIKLAHVESGLRSFDSSMPEEINRKIVDQLSDYLFVTEVSAIRNLHKEGIEGQIFYVGNTMIDTLSKYVGVAKEIDNQYGDYILVTLHRQSNVDDPLKLNKIVEFLKKISSICKIVFPVHPRTKRNLPNEIGDNILLIEPVGYIKFISLMINAKCVLTDSGGIQEETTWLNVPCITLRNNTERPVTIMEGTNTLANFDSDYIVRLIMRKINGPKYDIRIPLWDGHAAERISAIICKKYNE